MRFLVPIAFGVIGTAVLIGLGVWQMQRLAWKEAIIAEAEAAMQSDPVPLPAEIGPEMAYRAVRAEGTITQDELHVLTSRKATGPGFRVIAAFETDDGRRIMIDRGYVPEVEKNAERPLADATITGALLWPRETDSFTPEPNLEQNIWFARAVQPMAAALDAEPVLVVLDTPAGPAAPRPIPAGVNFPNRHLEYALTWFSLAVVWAGMTVYWVLRLRKAA